MFDFLRNIFRWESNTPLSADSDVPAADTSENSVTEQTPPIVANQSESGYRYYLNAQVQNTGEENGCGHASLSIMKRSADGEVVENNHLSYTVTGKVASLINGATVGSIPVSPSNRSDPTEDYEDATVILEREVSEEVFTATKKAHEDVVEGIEQGRYLYSVLSTHNPVASLAVSAMHNIVKAHESTRQNCCVENTDPCGFVVASSHFEEQEDQNTSTPEIHNCVTMVAQVLSVANINIGEAFSPTDITPLLERYGFMRVEKNDDQGDLPPKPANSI